MFNRYFSFPDSRRKQIFQFDQKLEPSLRLAALLLYCLRTLDSDTFKHSKLIIILFVSNFWQNLSYLKLKKSLNAIR